MAKVNMPMIDPREQPKMGKVIKNEVEIRKKTRKEKLKEAFIAQDLKSAAGYAIENYAIPSLKSLVVGLIFSTLNGIFYGQDGANFVNPANFGNSKPKYGSAFNVNLTNNKNNTTKKANALPEYSDILLNAGEVEAIRAALMVRAEEYGWVPYSIFYDAINMTSDYTKTQIGWTLEEIRDMKSMPYGFSDGEQKYIIVIARPKPYNG